MFNLHSLFVVPAAAAVISLGSSASAAVLQDFTGSGAPDGQYGSFSTTPGVDGILIQSPDDNGGIFTSIGGGSLALDGSDHLFITARLGTGNTTPFFRVLLLEEDGAGTGMAYGYQVDTSLLNTTTFTTVDLGEISTAFDIGPNVAFGRAPGDAIFNIDGGANEGLYEFQVQAGFNAAVSLDVTVASVEVAPVPEPASIALVGLGSLAMLARRRRQA